MRRERQALLLELPEEMVLSANLKARLDHRQVVLLKFLTREIRGQHFNWSSVSDNASLMDFIFQKKHLIRIMGILDWAGVTYLNHYL